MYWFAIIFGFGFGHRRFKLLPSLPECYFQDFPTVSIYTKGSGCIITVLQFSTLKSETPLYFFDIINITFDESFIDGDIM